MSMRPARANRQAPKRFDGFEVDLNPKKGTRVANAPSMTPATTSTTTSAATTATAATAANVATTSMRSVRTNRQTPKRFDGFEVDLNPKKGTRVANAPNVATSALSTSSSRSTTTTASRDLLDTAALMGQASPTTVCRVSYTVYDPQTREDLGGAYFGEVEAAARAAFRRNAYVKSSIKNLRGGVKYAKFWFRVRDRTRNVVTLYHVEVEQRKLDSAKRSKKKAFKRFIEDNVDCGEDGDMTILNNIHTYKVNVKGPVEWSG